MSYDYFERDYAFCPVCGKEYSLASQSCCPVCGKYPSKEGGYFISLPYKSKKTLASLVNYYDPAVLKQITVDSDEYFSLPDEEMKKYVRLSYYLVDEKEQNECFKFMSLIRHKTNSEAMMAGFETSIPSEPVTLERSTAEVVDTIKKDSSKLKQYLLHIVNIESDIIALNQQLMGLFQEKAANDDSLLKPLYLYVKRAQKKFDSLMTEKNDLEYKLDYPRRFESHEVWSKKLPKKPTAPVEPEKPILQQPGFFNKKRIQAENDKLMDEYNNKYHQYESALDEYKLSMERYENAVEKYNEDKKNFEKKKKEDARLAKIEAEKRFKEIDSEIETAEKDLNAAKKDPRKALPKTAAVVAGDFIEDEINYCEKELLSLIDGRNKLYSMGVIYIKYRSFIPVSSFYDYLASGRCSSLEGPDGAYNLYESEMRSNLVINQLSAALSSLEQIKANQFMAYSKLSSINNNISRMNDKMNSAISVLNDIKKTGEVSARTLNSIANNTKMVAYNTEKTAFYAEKNAELTNALGFMIALK